MKKSKTLNIADVPLPESPPNSLMMLRETRTILDLGSVPLSLADSWLRRLGSHDEVMARQSLPIIMLPGFASDQRYMKPLELYLSNLGYQTEDWGLGVNMAGMNMPHTLDQLSDTWSVEVYEGYTPETYKGEGGVPYLCDRATDRIRQRANELNSQVALVGWSLGGYVAREVARELPDQVAHVITLGAPVVGGPKYTKAAKAFELKGFNLDWIESESGKRDAIPIKQPITAIISKTDAVVNWRAALDRVSPNVEHIEVDVPHLGLGFNRSTWKLIEHSLAQYAQA